MKKCGFCGKEYGDKWTHCDDDFEPLIAIESQSVNSSSSNPASTAPASWQPLEGPKPPPTQPTEHSEPKSLNKVNLALVLRDVAIIFVLTCVGGVIIGFADSHTSPHSMLASQRFMFATAIGNLLLGTVGFAISGCLARGNRWAHLARVAVGVWLTGLINVVFVGTGIDKWLLSAFGAAMLMGIGGAISYIFRRDDRPSS